MMCDTQINNDDYGGILENDDPTDNDLKYSNWLGWYSIHGTFVPWPLKNKTSKPTTNLYNREEKITSDLHKIEK